ncbi:MAG: hypothetical protein V1792_10755 [Pseudomonadota bacterium]
MWTDPIVEEVRKVREEHAARFGYDLRAIYDDLKATEGQGGRKVVSLPPKSRVAGIAGEEAHGG